MYPAYLLKNIFHEAELLIMTRDHYEIINRLMDDMLAAKIIKFFDSMEELNLNERRDPIAQHLFQRYVMARVILEKKARQLTFHMEARDKGVLKAVKNMDITTAHLLFEDKDAAIEMLNWLLDNRQYWCATIEPRRVEDWRELEKCADEIEKSAMGMVSQMAGIGIQIDSCPDLKNRLKDNKEMFYAPNEKSRSTGMAYVFSAAEVLEIILHGFKFQKVCQEEKIRKSEWRAF